LQFDLQISRCRAKDIALREFISNTMTALSKIFLDAPRGTAASFLEKWRATNRLLRPELAGLGVSIVLFPVAATAQSISTFAQVDFVLGYAVVASSGVIATMVNRLADREADIAFKPGQAKALQVLGVRNILFQVVVCCVLVAVFGIILIIRTQCPLLLVTLGVLGAFLGVQYSLPPLHLKSRGVLEIVTVGIALFVIPPLVMMIAVLHRLDPMGTTAVVGFAMVACCLVLVKTAADFPEDRKFGVKTTAVYLGLVRTMYLAIALDLLGLSVVIYATISKRGIGPGIFIILVSGLLPLPYLMKIAGSLRGVEENQQIEAVRAHSRHLPIMLASTCGGMLMGELVSSRIF
jgi:4-hydroxybenzoate polyprenyltransferase